MIGSKSLHYDLCVFLWNYAALHSQIGSRIDRSSDEGIKSAQKHFQQSAGALESIKNDYLPHITSMKENFGPVEVSVLKLTTELMLAQAQLCFYEKAVKDKKAKPSIIAKLAAQVSLFYKTSYEFSKSSVMLGGYINPSWCAHFEFQSKVFRSTSEYWQSQHAKEVAANKGRLVFLYDFTFFVML